MVDFEKDPHDPDRYDEQLRRIQDALLAFSGDEKGEKKIEEGMQTIFRLASLVDDETNTLTSNGKFIERYSYDGMVFTGKDGEVVLRAPGGLGSLAMFDTPRLREELVTNGLSETLARIIQDLNENLLTAQGAVLSFEQDKTLTSVRANTIKNVREGERQGQAPPLTPEEQKALEPYEKQMETYRKGENPGYKKS